MALEPIEKFKDILEKTQNPLLLLPENPNGDALSATFGFAAFLKKKGIAPVVVLSDSFGQEQRFGFLPHPEVVQKDLSGARDFVLIFNTEHNKITNVRKEEEGNELRIFLTPDRGSIDPRDFSFIPAQYKFDLVVTFGCPDKESLGAFYEHNADLLYEIPVVNIDFHSENDSFGQVNIVNLVASSVSEVVAEILYSIDKEGVDELAAQCLLSGIISATDSFQKKNTTPQAFHFAAKLIEQGADQQEIIKNLYKTQPFSLIKLLGRVMAKIAWNDSIGLLWTRVEIEDFVQSRTNHSDLPIILDRLRTNYSAGRFFLILYRKASDSLVALLTVSDSENIRKVAQAVGGELRGEYIERTFSQDSMEGAEEKIIEQLSTL